MWGSLLEGKVAVVTGGTGGIGREIVKRFVEHGAKVAVFGRNQTKGEALSDLMNLSLPEKRVLFFQVDSVNCAEVDRAVKEVLAVFGAVDILVNNAGIVRDGLLMRMSEEDWDAVMETNVKSCYNASKAVIRPMIKAKHGKIINMSSVIGIAGNAGQTNYAASKAAIIGFTKALAREVASKGIRVNSIAPGYIDAGMTEGLAEAQSSQILPRIPLGCFGAAGDVANLVLFLASSLADYITGQVITVDGGMTI